MSSSSCASSNKKIWARIHVTKPDSEPNCKPQVLTLKTQDTLITLEYIYPLARKSVRIVVRVCAPTAEGKASVSIHQEHGTQQPPSPPSQMQNFLDLKKSSSSSFNGIPLLWCQLCWMKCFCPLQQKQWVSEAEKQQKNMIFFSFSCQSDWLDLACCTNFPTLGLSHQVWSI
jgi:hypothetical protein